MASTRDWNARAYERTAQPIQDLGRRLLDGLELRGDETVLDAGCGSGGVTRALAQRLPRGRVIAVDGSPSMVALAREALAASGRVEVLLGDLAELELAEPVDVVFSSATFHWIADHDRLFARLHAALRPGGRLLAQCGGEGNIAETMRALEAVSGEAPFAAHLAGWAGPWTFAAPEATVQRLERAGFIHPEAGLHTVTVRPDEPLEFFRTVMLGSHLERLPAALREPFTRRVVGRLPSPVSVDYVRLTLSARRP